MATATAPSKGPDTGKQQRKADAAAKIKEPNLRKYYGASLPALVPGSFEFLLHLLRPGLPPMHLRTVDSLTWNDDQSALSGSITAHRPVPGDPESLPVRRGNLVRCRVKWADGTYQLWTMRAAAPQTQVDSNTVTIALSDDMALLQAGKEDWFFRKTKARPQGWTAAEITVAVAQRRGIKLKLPLPKCSQRFALVKRKTSAFTVLVEAWKNEKDAQGRPFVMQVVNGELQIEQLRRNPIVYVLKREIQTALIQASGSGGIPPTSLTGVARVGSGKSSKKISYTATDKHAVRVLGNVHKRHDYGTVSSPAELKKLVNRDLAKALRVNKTVSIQHAGIPFIRRGDAARIDLPVEGYAGEQSFVWCSQATHTVQAGVYTTSFDFVGKDLYLVALKQIAAQQAAKSGGLAPSATGGTGTRWLVPASAEDDPPGTTSSCGVLPGDGRGYSVLSVSGTSGDSGTAGQALSSGTTWPCGAVLLVTNPANNRTVAIRHVDNGAGSDSILPVIGLYPQTRRDLGLDDSGSYQVIIEAGSGSPAIHPLRGHPV